MYDVLTQVGSHSRAGACDPQRPLASTALGRLWVTVPFACSSTWPSAWCRPEQCAALAAIVGLHTHGPNGTCNF